MNCLITRKLLLSSPRGQSAEVRAHIDGCATCRSLASELAKLNRAIEEAALVAVPDALTHRILLKNRRRSAWHYMAAAAGVVAVVFSGFVLLDVFEVHMPTSTVEVVGPSHSAVAAITLVADGRTELARAGDDAEMQQRLKQLGLALDAGDVHAYYAGKCQMARAECDLIILDTPESRANVVLMPHDVLAKRVLVSDRQMTALVTPAKAGSYIVVADSPKVAKRMQRLFRRG
ncbi:MAG: DUF3379 family protein [Pseudomonadota bacterium]